MTTIHKTSPSHPDGDDFASHDEGIEALGRAVSLLRSWAATPQQFDHISGADRQNLFLLALEAAEQAQSKLSRSQ